jgi:putative FmdB family regulatory protein
MMPTYEYECISCNIRYEITEKIAEHTAPYCCNLAMRQVYHAPGVSFKGTGWGKDA